MSENEAFEIEAGTDHRGTHGLMQFVPYFDPRPEHKAQLCCYLINAPTYYSEWSQYMLLVASLAKIEDVADPWLKFPDATHEVLVVVVDPTKPQTVESILESLRAGKPVPTLTPPNIVEQFQATDSEIMEMAWLVGRAVVRGNLNPETVEDHIGVREQWLQACTTTLARLRGKEHLREPGN